MEQQLSGGFFTDADNVFTAVQEILDSFDKPTLIKVFVEWVRRLEQWIEAEPEQVGSAKQCIWFHSVWFGASAPAPFGPECSLESRRNSILSH
jgi:hypothetical protein